ncbi:hypothetical protein G5C60_46845 [Streptomyces sp. HC44]|uniref:Uncharacterized protein n=1 Tax=Streptomyces scabichelini TaxID=2711217 RepID=A0A6G4VMA8_9ACTN|nr:hypothetical protein [Streptomyces scabichelini]NGO14917.1 hypothetical protein [Streptomyces scabichelini]
MPVTGPEDADHTGRHTGRPEDPDVLPCASDPDVECVRIGSEAHTGGGALAAPPPGGPPEPPADEHLCPPGYVPRRRRSPLPTEGKRVLRPGPPERNPAADERGRPG